MRKINISLAGIFSLVMVTFISSSVTSCGSKADENNNDTTSKDTTAAYTMSPELQALVAKFKESKEFPYKVDTTVLNAGNMAGDSLTGADVGMLSVNWFKHELVSGVEWDLSSFNKIDSIKVAGKYKEYCDEMEPGETKTANAYALTRLMLDKDTWILVWALHTESYQACPYSNTNAVYFTVIYKGQVGESFIMGERTVAGDPPASLEKEVSSTFDKDGKLVIKDEEEGSDDGEQLESQKDVFEFKLVNGKLEKGKEKIGKEVVTKIEEEK
jgi:hypothetical protein